MTTPASFHEEESLGKAYDSRLMRRLLGYVRPHRAIAGWALLLLFIEGGLQLVGPWLTKQVIDVALPAGDVRMVQVAAGLFALSLIAQFACGYGETVLTGLLGQRVMHDLRRALFAHLQRLSIPFFDRNPVGRLITRVTSDVEALNELFTAGVVAGLGDLFTLGAISVMMLVVDWRLAVASFLVIPVVVVVSRLFQRAVRDSYRDIRTRLARINAFLQERLTGLRIVQLFGRERHEGEQFDRLNDAHLEAHLRSIRVYALYFPVIELLTTIALASLLVAASERMAAQTLSVGTVAAFLQLVRRFFQPLQDLSEKYNILQGAMAASERIFRLLDTAPSVPDAGEWTAGSTPSPAVPSMALTASSGREPAQANGARSVGATSGMRAPAAWVGDAGAPPASEATTGALSESHLDNAERSVRPRSPSAGVTVEFHDVWFAYDQAHGLGVTVDSSASTPGRAAVHAEPDWVLRGVSFRARPGETVALVGHTGAGKTTIISLLLRFYDPQRGRITVDGVDIRDLPLRELRSLIGYVQQDIFLFAGDVTSNIRLSGTLTDDEVEEAARRVGADRIVRRFPDAYRHVLGERGASISVGERQLLSFARAIAADPALLLLDEATSAVDSEIEAEIQRALAVLMRGRTTLAVAHRLSTIVGADEILVLHHGQIRERGTHRALLARGGLYERLYRLQVAPEHSWRVAG